MLSLAWTGWSWTATERLAEGGVEVTRSLTPVNPARPDPASLNLDVPFIDDEDRPTTGLVMGNPNMNSANEEEQFNNRHGSSLWKLNVVLVLISCWVAASLTGWGTISGGIGEGGEHTAANPLVGRFNMAMICLSQTLAVGLYLWTLLPQDTSLIGTFHKEPNGMNLKLERRRSNQLVLRVVFPAILIYLTHRMVFHLIMT